MSLKPMAGWTEATTTTELATPIKSDDGEVTQAVSKITHRRSGRSPAGPATGAAVPDKVSAGQ